MIISHRSKFIKIIEQIKPEIAARNVTTYNGGHYYGEN